MSFDLRELYQEIILDHYRHPRNQREPERATAHSEGHNPLCGDKITVSVRTENGQLAEVGYHASGCAISVASASLMSEAVKGKPLGEVERLCKEFQGAVTSPDGGEFPEMGDLNALAGVREHPVRIKCATLPWHALRAALSGVDKMVTTE
ncbi:MAG: SUF system NifU family Fe-S cluster assembly protein [Fimbriimonas ginsengisoli]|uniref:SUF system NifU family Fe-S cluster assembly protein n=1 Tax=Fimbriimonas ginsengisoli TaxID=1005039 RepID=A0A931LS66_FIMGI|nr:SUF system NifU family Fe-S cluster assembly protein [Fimbriimonas ginsengisoli]MBI3722325.1 SUF system NifU family Fe-S cluster assembly protein [Fimbriimonas ginsengisoli]